MTLRAWLARAEAGLRQGPHPERARQDAETLLLHLIGKSRAWLLAHLEDDFAGCPAIRFEGLIQRRLAGEPIQYITGETEFYGLPLLVSPDVLIPRPETEHLVETVITLAAQFQQPRIVDIGVGSGAIAVALAHHLQTSSVTAIDVSEAALAIAQRNAERNGVRARIRFLQGDLLVPIDAERFDLVVSNPPYVASVDREALSIEVREHEPALALFAGIDGLDVYRRLIPAAHSALAAGGFVALEIGFGQSEAIESMLRCAAFIEIAFTPDLQGIPRVATAQKPIES